MPQCPHGMPDDLHCPACIAGCWKMFQESLAIARERLPDTAIPALLICLNTDTGEYEIMTPEWIRTRRDLVDILKRLIRRARVHAARRDLLE